MTAVLEQLVAMSRRLGEPGRDLVILAEGNSSARHDAASFWVKASGACMGTADAGGYLRVDHAAILRMLGERDLGDAAIRSRLRAAVLEGDDSKVPSVETLIHALCLQQNGVDFVGHTHPTAVNQITCSKHFRALLDGRAFPDEIVVNGLAPLLVAYHDPGWPLARAIAAGLESHRQEHGEAPRLVWMQNHGLLALGRSAAQVEQVTAMAVKTARVISGAAALGGVQFLTEEAALRIHTRPDEHHRQRQLDRDA